MDVGAARRQVFQLCYFTSTETVRTIRDKEPRWTLGLLEGNCSSCVTLRLQKPYGLLGTGSPGGRWDC